MGISRALNHAMVFSSLRIHSQVLSPESISERLATNASAAHRFGDLMSPGNPRSQRFAENLWTLDLDDRESIPETLQLLRQTLERFGESLLSLGDSCTFDFFVSCHLVANDGFILDADFMSDLANKKIDLVCDIYFASSED